MVRNLKDSLKGCRWDAARYSLRFLADLVNCHVVSASSLLQLLENMVDVAKEDGVPNVSLDDIYLFPAIIENLAKFYSGGYWSSDSAHSMFLFCRCAKIGTFMLFFQPSHGLAEIFLRRKNSSWKCC